MRLARRLVIMPQPDVRHAGTAWQWGPNPSRSEIARRAAADDPQPPKRPPARKDTRSWCKGKVGREHIPVLELEPPALTNWACGWRADWRVRAREYGIGWACYHREVCQRCRKVLREPRELARAECPAYPGDPAQKAAAEAEAVEMEERHWTWWQRRRRVIAGPQGYRRKR
jgi:hypothetical protein